jgi:hypothetical protein
MAILDAISNYFEYFPSMVLCILTSEGCNYIKFMVAWQVHNKCYKGTIKPYVKCNASMVHMGINQSWVS